MADHQPHQSHWRLCGFIRRSGKNHAARGSDLLFFPLVSLSSSPLQVAGGSVGSKMEVRVAGLVVVGRRKQNGSGEER